MLKVSKNTNYKKIIPYVLVVVLLLGTGGYYVMARGSDDPAKNTTQVNENQNIDAVDKKQELVDPGSGKPDESTSNNSTPHPASSIDLSAKQEANNSVTVFSKLFNIGSGTCNLTVVNGNNSASQQAEVIYQSEFSTCAGFSIPIAGLGSGTWTITLSVSGNPVAPTTITFGVR